MGLPTNNEMRDFSRLRAKMDRLVETETLPGISISVQENRETIETYCTGWADYENKIPLGPDHLFRGFSNTKLVTSCAALKLLDAKKMDLDDPVEKFLPEFANMRVLRCDAATIEDTYTADSLISLRHLLTHTSGIGHDKVNTNSLVAEAYQMADLYNPAETLADMVNKLADCPLVCAPGAGFNYGFSTDVVARVVEVVDGRSFSTFLCEEIFEPLEMKDTGFWIPEEKGEFLTKFYRDADAEKRGNSGLVQNTDDNLNEQLFSKSSLEMGGIGLLFSLSDMVKLLNALDLESSLLFGRDTRSLLYRNLLPKNIWAQLPGFIDSPGTGHSAAGAITVKTLPNEHPDLAGSCWWSGRAGTHWWICPEYKLSVAVMTQKDRAFNLPFNAEIRNLVCSEYAD